MSNNCFHLFCPLRFFHGKWTKTMYRVSRYSCHPLISLCARMEKNNRVPNWPPCEMSESRTCYPQKWQSPQLAIPKLTRILDYAIFGGGKFGSLVILQGGQLTNPLFFFHSGNYGVARIAEKPVRGVSRYIVYLAATVLWNFLHIFFC